MPIGRNQNYELIYVLIAMLVIICMCVLGRFTAAPMMHLAQDVQLREFETAFKSTQHPTQTKQISFKTLSGDITDSKKGCDYFVGEIRSYQGSRGEIINGYASQSVKDAGKIHVAFVENDSILSEDAVSPPNPLNTLAGWEIPPIELEQPLYVIYIFIIEYQGARNLDCR